MVFNKPSTGNPDLRQRELWSRRAVGYLSVLSSEAKRAGTWWPDGDGRLGVPRSILPRLKADTQCTYTMCILHLYIHIDVYLYIYYNWFYVIFKICLCIILSVTFYSFTSFLIAQNWIALPTYIHFSKDCLDLQVDMFSLTLFSALGSAWPWLGYVPQNGWDRIHRHSFPNWCFLRGKWWLNTTQWLV